MMAPAAMPPLVPVLLLPLPPLLRTRQAEASDLPVTKEVAITHVGPMIGGSKLYASAARHPLIVMLLSGYSPNSFDGTAAGHWM
jgi:hypothetical protein